MNRDLCTRRLVRILQRIDSGQVPAKIKEAYVYGSYSHGAPDPYDLDLIVVYQDPGAEFWKEAQKPVKDRGYGEDAAAWLARRHYEVQLRNALRGYGQQVDLTVTSDLDNFLAGSDTVSRGDLVLLWSEMDRDWESKVAQIVPDPEARQALQEGMFPLRRIEDKRATVRKVVRWIAEERLVLTRIPIESIKLKLDPLNRSLVSAWRKGRGFSEQVMETLRYALYWLQSHGQHMATFSQMDLWSERMTHRVHVGWPSLANMLFWFRNRPSLERQCLIPYFEKGGRNELLVFERGPRWAEPEESENEGSPP